MLKSACYFIGVLSVLVIAHEWGHFIVAKLCKMRVDDFSLFFGPRLWRIGKFNGTEYNIRSIPLGGFVKIAGMEPEDSMHPSGSIIHGANLDSGGFNWEKYDRSLLGLEENTFAEVRFENVSERIVDAVFGAIDDDGRLTASGLENLNSLLLSTGINSDEHAYIEGVINASESATRPDPDSYNQKPLWQRAAVIFAGPMMSLLFGYALFCSMGFTYGLPDPDNHHPAVGEVTEGKPAEAAGLKTGDWIMAVNGKAVDFTNIYFALRSSVDPFDKTKALPIRLTVQRAGKPMDVVVAPFIKQDVMLDEHDHPRKGKDGKEILGAVSQIGITVDSVWTKYGLVKSIREGTSIIKDEVVSVRTSIFSKDVKNNVGGIITIGKVIHENSKQGSNHVLYVAAMLSVSLGIMNLFPIPVLDGGHLMLLLWEGLRRRKLTGREVYGAQMVGLCIIGVLFVLITFNDIVHWVHRQ